MQHVAEGRFADARAAFASGIDVDPTHIPLYHAWGSMEMDVANVSSARAIFQRGVWACPEGASETVSLWVGWALLEERDGNCARAREYFREALKRDRFAVDVRVAWAGMEARRGQLEVSRQLFEDALRLDPQNAEVARLECDMWV